MPSDLLVATTNPGKIREIFHILQGVPFNLRTLADFPDIPVPDETGSTFMENARQKAFHYAAGSGILTMAEDSGFEVDALNKEPGIHSARYLRPDATYDERFADIYNRVSHSTVALTCRFVCSLVLADRDRTSFATTATVEGLLAPVPAGPNGFGYDPIFFYPAYQRTFGEVSDAEKTAVSHRGQAVRSLREYLAQG